MDLKKTYSKGTCGKYFNLAMGIAMAIIMSFMGISCDELGGDSDDDSLCKISKNVYAPTKVKWWIDENGYLNWDNAADVFYWDNGSDYSIDITWYCADYEGFKTAYVSLDFWDWSGDGQGWILESEFVDPDGICEEDCL